MTLNKPITFKHLTIFLSITFIMIWLILICGVVIWRIEVRIQQAKEAREYLYHHVRGSSSKEGIQEKIEIMKEGWLEPQPWMYELKDYYIRSKDNE